jgi:hypothetical protein
MKKLLCLLSLILAATGAWGEDLFYPEGETLMVARVRSLKRLADGFNHFKAWFEAQSSLVDFWAPASKPVLDFDPEAFLAKFFETSSGNLDAFFPGSVTLIVDEDANSILAGKIPGLTAVVELSSEELAQKLFDLVKGSECVEKASLEEDEVSCTRLLLKSEGASSAGAKEKYFFAMVEGRRFWLATSTDSLAMCLKAQKSGFMPDFFRKANSSDLCVWIDPKPVEALAKNYLEKRQAETGDSENHTKPFLPADILDKLGLDGALGIGASADLDTLEFRLEVATAPDAGGIFKVFKCAPSGLEPSPLVPDTADEFAIGRFDIECLWQTVKELLTSIFPATSTIYNGWEKQILDSYGVAVDHQLFGAMGTHYISYGIADEQGGHTRVMLMELKDCVAFKQALEAVIEFFSQGKTYFDKQTVSGTTIYRLKGEFQANSASSIAYAISPKWLIICAGGPSEIANVVESLSTERLCPLWKLPALKGMDDQRIPLTSFGYRTMANFWDDLATMALEFDFQKSSRDKTAPLWSLDTFPDFSAIPGDVSFRVYLQPELLTALLKFHVEQ